MISRVTTGESRAHIGAGPTGTGRNRRERLADALFPEPEPALLHGWRRAVLFAALIAAGVILSLARMPVASWNTLWAEDGSVFLDGVLGGGPLEVLEPYAGYLHLVPRLAISIALMVPIDVVPLAVTIVSALITSLSAAACFLFLETRMRSVLLRIAVWAIVLIIPNAGGEVVNNLANLHWFLMVAAVAALVVRAPARGFAIVQCVVVVAAVGSDPLMLLFTPLLLIRIVLLRSARDRAVAVSFVAATVLQVGVSVVGVVLNGSRSFSRELPQVPDLVDFYTFRVVISGLIGTSATERWGEALGAGIPGLIVAGVLAVVIFAAVRDRKRRYVIVAFALSSLLFFSVVVCLQWNLLAVNEMLNLSYSSRYALLPTALLLFALVLAVDGFIEGTRAVVGLVVSAIVIVLVAIPSVVDYRWVQLRDGAPAWHEALAQAENRCAADGGGYVQVDIAPKGFSAPSIPCAAIMGATR